ncbi:MAG TPA: septal ring lytic transglycosylase RlpA family protein [Candidatus Omnitrophota bacterium]|nr:septal ring lytic transglycosylase RlpA family protein [Candidatus Omnitrophota bacterium]HPD85590.1 septal ring lytic transglycosylase RlpA family protein [Candidatus Omnitrophota bacterium]HRZ04370.1 septal ring lytic transglycosylase RlpA family protein [Candidatus Omnitrophota bacterium]
MRQNQNIFTSILAGAVLLSLGGCEDYKPVKGEYPTTGEAAWYVVKLAATGKRHNNYGLTCAMRKNDYGKYYRVCNTENGKCVVVRHNDFGPGIRLYNQGRIIDLSKMAFSRIADLKKGVIPVTIEEIDSKKGAVPKKGF